MARQITLLLLLGCFYYGSSVHQRAAIITSSSDYEFIMMITHCYHLELVRLRGPSHAATIMRPLHSHLIAYAEARHCERRDSCIYRVSSGGRSFRICQLLPICWCKLNRNKKDWSFEKLGTILNDDPVLTDPTFDTRLSSQNNCTMNT